MGYRVTGLAGHELDLGLRWFTSARIGLVPASRPADVLAAIGLNDVNRDMDPATLAELWAMCDEFWPVDQPGTALWSVNDIAGHIARNPDLVNLAALTPSLAGSPRRGMRQA